jgi:photosynthetic reaction center H subunit
MGTGAITAYIDVAQLTLYVFWIFFAGLCYYLHQEDKREGYPLESDRSIRSGGRVRVEGWPPIPKPKTFRMADGTSYQSPSFRPSPHTQGASPALTHLGAPLEPNGDPMLAAVGPGSYAHRADVADITAEGVLRVVPLRVATDFGIDAGDPDPRGMPVIGADGDVGGTVRDLWIDRSEMLFRYLEVDVATASGTRRVLLPVTFSRIGDRVVKVRSILSTQFADVPLTRNADTVTRLEEDKITAYYGGGTLYATPQRQEPLL